MIYVYFFIKSVVKCFENSVRSEFFMGIAFQTDQILRDFISQCEIWHVIKQSFDRDLIIKLQVKYGKDFIPRCG